MRTFWTNVTWFLAGAALVLGGTLPFVTTGKAAILPVLLLAVPVALIDGVRRYGWVTLLFFVVETLLISNFFENLSVETGFPFGDYHYTGGPQLIHVPIYIGPVYFGLGYLCWRVAELLLADGRRRAVDMVAVPALAAALMTVFDLGSDSVASTVNHTWEWERGGGVFGVPYTNYLGWWLVTYLFFQVFAIHLSRRRAPVQEASPAAAAIVYAALALNAVAYFLVADDYTVTDPSGAVWNHQALAETMMLINLSAVLPFALLALRSAARKPRK
ncbi:carotenoid biosynthesis protein [Streptomyces justiciae]|uniref:carotenoid biosynthesis protein n=1 Tax=Streptomyces justiciae TaxID=2780140 RepID=UPI001882BD38|nr:carotenoid biosynthesis protein [Streptomyces justiciae]MBE8475608.1 carotenoid biosynthesis protein [Streptomyces justiciae]MCW8382531.1 carotenoid biosynthesis protein [Streptomyces justiciae]